jgi:hypothetical protein
MSTRVRILLVPLLAGLVMAAGCDQRGDGMTREERAEAYMEELKLLVHELAAMIGSEVEVQYERFDNCDDSLDDGKPVYPAYTVYVTSAEGTIDRIKGEIFAHYEAAGWRAVERSQGASFHKDGFDLGATANSEGKAGRASVGGSGPCTG